MDTEVNRACILKPLGGRKRPTRWLMTHPPIEERVARLRSHPADTVA